MSKRVIGKIIRYHSDNLPPDTETDWEKVMAMSDEEIRARALADPDAQPLTPERLARMRRKSDIPPEKRKRRAR